MFGRIITSLGLALAASGAGAARAAAQQPPVTITFEQAIQVALRQNPDVRRAENATAAEDAAVTRQKLQFLPDLRLTTQAGSSVGRAFNQDEGAIVNETTSSLNAGISSSVTLFDGLKNVSNLKSAQLGRTASEYDLERMRQTVVMTVASDFLALVRAEEQLLVRQQALSAQQAELAQIQVFVAAGKRPSADLYQQQAALAAARAAVVEAERVRGRARIDVIETLQLDAVGEYDFRAPELLAEAAVAGTESLDALIARALDRRVDLDAVEARESAALLAVRAAGASRWPTLSLTGSYNTGASSASALSLQDQLEERRGGSVSLGVSIPLFDRLATSIATEQARLQAANARLDVERQRQSIALEVRRVWLDRASAAAQLEAARAGLAAAEQALEATTERYRVGAATLLEVTQARASQVAAASAIVDARTSLALQGTLLGYFTGALDAAAPLGGA